MPIVSRANMQLVVKHFARDEAGSVKALRAHLLIELKNHFAARKWTRSQAAKILGVSVQRISEIETFSTDKFTVELLVKYLYRANKEVSLKVQNRPD